MSAGIGKPGNKNLGKTWLVLTRIQMRWPNTELHNLQEWESEVHLCHGGRCVRISSLCKGILILFTTSKGKSDLILATVLRMERFLEQMDSKIVS